MKIQIQTATYTLKIEATPAEQEFALTMIRELVAPTSAPVEEPTEEPTEEFTLSPELDAAIDAFDNLDSPTEEFTLPTELDDAFDDFDSPTEATTEELTEELTEEPTEEPAEPEEPACPIVQAQLEKYATAAQTATLEELDAMLEEMIDLADANHERWNRATIDECDRVFLKVEELWTAQRDAEPLH